MIIFVWVALLLSWIMYDLVSLCLFTCFSFFTLVYGCQPVMLLLSCNSVGYQVWVLFLDFVQFDALIPLSYSSCWELKEVVPVSWAVASLVVVSHSLMRVCGCHVCLGWFYLVFFRWRPHTRIRPVSPLVSLSIWNWTLVWMCCF